jgi:nucleotide-binding universal stress UspA family protein
MIPETRTVLCALDLEPDSGAVLRQAVGSAHAHGARLILLHVVEGMSPSSRAMIRNVMSDDEIEKIHVDGLAHLRREFLDRLKAFCERELPDGMTEATAIAEIHFAEGPTAQTIVDEARRLGADLLVMGLHSRTGLGRLLVGSVARRVLHLARQPVLLVPTASSA